eukprot:c17348_g2_i1 orf=79-1509(+)
MATLKLTSARVLRAIAGKDYSRGSQQLLGMCKAVPPLVFTCVAVWFFCFLINHSTPRPPIQRSNNPNQGKSAHIEDWHADQQRESNAEEHGLNTSSSHMDAWRSNQQRSSSDSKQGSSDVLPFKPTCNLAWGRWIPDVRRKPAYDESCRDIFKGWNCLRNNKSNAKDILAWRWQPWHCDLPQMNATLFLERFKNKRIGFVGDSLNRNMYVSLVCSLRQASQQVRKWRPVGADKALTFLDYNVTIAYHRTNLLARYGQWEAKEDEGQLEKLGFSGGYRVDIDVPQNTWAEAPQFHDVLILNTGHWWWAPGKFDPLKSPMLFFDGGEPIIPTKSPEEGLDLVLKNMLAFIEEKMPPKGLRFLRTQSPRHFEGGDWNEGGKCHRQKPLDEKEAEAFFALNGKHGPNLEMSKANLHLKKAIQGTSFQLLNISYLSSLRADAHPSLSAGKLHEDCMHWCLPGITDTWNDMLVLQLLQEESK